MFRKLLTAFMASLILIGAALTTVSAEKHEVQYGESLWDIAHQYKTTVNELVKLNNLKSVVLQPKQVLIINENSNYTVKNGDTLTEIAQDHGVTVTDLMKWNDLHTSLIVVGQKLEIHGVDVKDVKKEQVKEEKAAAEEATVPVKKSEKPATQIASTEIKSEGKTVSVTATAYTAKCDGCSGVTYTGVDLNANPNAKVIAVDPNVIPLGSKVYVEGYGYATAADIGGAIKGNKIDIHVPTKDEAFSWGVRTVNVTIVE